MDKIKLDRPLFEFMEKMTKEGKYNYEQFIHELSILVKYHYDFKGLFLELAEIEPYFDKNKREETLEKLLKAYMFGYEKKVDTYTIVLFEKDGFDYVLWEADGKYEVSIKEEYHEDETFKKTFTWEEIIEKFPNLSPLARKNK